MNIKVVQDQLCNRLGFRSTLIILIIFYTTLQIPFHLIYSLEMREWQLYLDGGISLFLIKDLLLRDKNSSYPLLILSIIACIPIDLILFYMGDIPPLLSILGLSKASKIIDVFERSKILPRSTKVQISLLFSFTILHAIACFWTALEQVVIKDNIVSMHIDAFYWAVTTLTTIGYGDIVPVTDAGKLFTILVMILGAAIYGVIIANISKMLIDVDRRKNQSKKKLNDLTNFMKYYKIPIKLQGTVLSYCDHFLKKESNKIENEFLSELPKALQKDLRTYIDIKLIRAIPSFNKLSISCLKDLVKALNQEVFSPSQSILKIGDHSHKMYIIMYGSVQLHYEDEELPLFLSQGEIFGEECLLKKMNSRIGVRSHSYCDTYTITKKNFEKVLSKNPSLMKFLKEIKKFYNKM